MLLKYTSVTGHANSSYDVLQVTTNIKVLADGSSLPWFPCCKYSPYMCWLMSTNILSSYTNQRLPWKTKFQLRFSLDMHFWFWADYEKIFLH